MKRIRIGNDIRVQTSLHDLNDFDITSIKQLRCYFIPQCDSYTTPATDTYDPMQYTICNCGKPKYNVFPCNIDAPHWFCGYNGFGVNSKRFIHVDNKFLAPSRLLAEQNRIEAYFPAKAQYQIGEYKFVIVLTIYQPGWCEYNLRTITLDEGVIFALTSDDRDPDHDSIIDLDTTYSINYTIATDLSVEGDNKIYTTHSEMQLDKQFGSFTVFDKRSTKNLDDIIVTSDGCVIKEIHRGIESIEYGINGPITANNGEIKISCILKETPKPVDKEYTYDINYYYDDQQCTIEGPQQIKVLDSKRFLNEKIGSFYVTCIGENPDSSNIQLKVTGCNVQNSAGDETSCKYDLYGPITTSNGVINVEISIKSNTMHITSITVPDKLTLGKQPSIGIQERDFVNTVYKILLNYSDGSHKSVTADEFGSLIDVEYTLSTNISVDDQTGQINKLDRFKDINTEITYSLRENQSIQATTQIISAGKYHTIKYTCPGVLTVNGPEELFVYDTINNMGQSGTVLTSFTVTKTPGASSEFQANEVTGDGCTITKDANDSNKFHMCTPVTKDNITITIVANNPFEE